LQLGLKKRVVIKMNVAVQLVEKITQLGGFKCNSIEAHICKLIEIKLIKLNQLRDVEQTGLK